MNQDSYNSNSLGFDQPQPPQSPVIHQPPQELSIQGMEDLKQQYLDELKHLSNLNIVMRLRLPSSRKIVMEEDYTSGITPDEPALSTEEPDNSLSMGDEHLDTIPATESNEFIKSGFENLIPIPCEISSSLTKNFLRLMTIHSLFDKIDYVEASPPDSELVSSEVMEIVIPEVGGIEASNDNPIPFYDPIISGTPLNLTPSGESDFFRGRCIPSC
nr:hypothetical protein [Tanacetum cinerariifolium]